MMLWTLLGKLSQLIEPLAYNVMLHTRCRFIGGRWLIFTGTSRYCREQRKWQDLNGARVIHQYATARRCRERRAGEFQLERHS